MAAGKGTMEEHAANWYENLRDVDGSRRVHEDGVRFLRQVLLALEEGREEDADVLEDFVKSEFGINYRILAVDDVHPRTLDRWRTHYFVPMRNGEARDRHVAVLRDFNNEPIWRAPARYTDDDDPDPVGEYETPYHILLEYLDPIEYLDLNLENVPDHHKPRSSGELPKKVRDAMRVWVPEGFVA